MLQQKADAIIAQQPFNGLVWIKKGNSILYSKTQGYADLSLKNPISPEQQFVVGSVSKQITAAMILQARTAGMLRLSDPISAFLPQYAQPWANQVTIHHLLTHTHGIVAFDQPAKFIPGAQFEYSQIGFELLAQILEKVHAASFEDISTRFFEQCHLKNTCHPNRRNPAKFVKSYEIDAQGIYQFAAHSTQNYVAAGAFVSTADDLCQWNTMLHQGQIVDMESLELMKTRHATRQHPTVGPVEYGYGLLFKNGENNLEIGAFGYAPGFKTTCYHYPQTGIDLVVLSNMAGDLSNMKYEYKIHTDLMALVKSFPRGAF